MRSRDFKDRTRGPSKFDKMRPEVLDTAMADDHAGESEGEDSNSPTPSVEGLATMSTEKRHGAECKKKCAQYLLSIYVLAVLFLSRPRFDSAAF